MNIVNVATYRFTPLNHLSDLKAKWLPLCEQWQLKGTVVLSPEGINLMLAGTDANVAAFCEVLAEDERLRDLQYKRADSEFVPFKRMMIKIKRKLTPFAEEVTMPSNDKEARRLQCRELKRWLDEGKEFTLLDVRNNYEVEHGTFRGAKNLDIKHFSDFTEAATHLTDDLKHKPLVTFCTGGIRCEKVVPFLKNHGFDVYQLEGGILQYFRECGAAHFDGECFVFDERIATTP